MEVNEIYNALGLNADDIKSIDDFKEKFQGEFIRRNAAHNDPNVVEQVVGSKMKKIESTVSKAVKEFGIEIKDEDLTGLKYTDEKVGAMLKKAAEHYSTTVSELKKIGEAKGNDKFNELNEQFQKQSQKLKDFEDLNKSLAEQIKEKEQFAKDEIKRFKISDARHKAFSSLPFKDGMTELEREGFNSLINKKYEIDLDENGETFIYERETKKRIENKAVIGTHLGVNDVFKMEMEANGLAKKNPHSYIKPPVDPFNGKKNDDDPDGKGGKVGMPMSPKFLKKHE